MLDTLTATTSLVKASDSKCVKSFVHAYQRNEGFDQYEYLMIDVDAPYSIDLTKFNDLTSKVNYINIQAFFDETNQAATPVPANQGMEAPFNVNVNGLGLLPAFGEFAVGFSGTVGNILTSLALSTTSTARIRLIITLSSKAV